MNEVNLARQDRFSDVRAYARSTEFRATMLDAQRTLFKPRIISTQAELTKLTETATEGDQVLCRNGQGGLWRFVYDPNNPEITDAYKWVFMGGAALRDYVETDQGTASVFPTAVSLGGPDITLPYLGIYTVEYGYEPYATGGAAIAVGQLYVAGGLAYQTDASFAAVGTASAGNVGRTGDVTALAASSFVDVRYCTSAFTAQFRKRWLTGIPQRIGP